MDVATLKRVQSNCSAGWREGMAHVSHRNGHVTMFTFDEVMFLGVFVSLCFCFTITPKLMNRYL